jgi:hypothetical protein
MERNCADLYLGGVVDPATGERTGEDVAVAAHHLTTHGVIVGMTGSGKTGLGVVFLEEALLAGVPVLVLDPKGDMGNLLVKFPHLRPGDFRPWVDAAVVLREGVEVDVLATSTASAWRDGLASWGIGPDRIRRLRDAGADADPLSSPGRDRLGDRLHLDCHDWPRRPVRCCPGLARDSRPVRPSAPYGRPDASGR